MALPREPLTKEQTAEFSKHISKAFEARPSHLFLMTETAGKPLPDTITFKFPWRVRLWMAWDRFLKWAGIMEREPVTIRWHQIKVSYEIKQPRE